jgi:hypothetical protein
MRRVVLVTAMLGLVALTGCSRMPDAPGPAAPEPAGVPRVAIQDARQVAVYAAVLRQYLTSGDHSFGAGHTFPGVYVLDTTDTAVADPMAQTRTGAGRVRREIPAADQAAILGELSRAGVEAVSFITDRGTVIDTVDGCQQVRGGGILIGLGPVTGEGDRAEVGINGFVACLGATWFTYVVERDGPGWRVNGTTGPMAIA